MKTIILILMLAIGFHIFAQKIDSVGYLSNLKGSGICLRKGYEEKLKIPYYFLNGDRVKMVNGNAIIVLFTEDEVKLATGEYYDLTFDENIKTTNKELLMFRNTKQSSSSFKMRGTVDPNNIAFPKKSKIIDPANAIIRIRNKQNTSKYFFNIKDKENNQKIFELLNADSVNINLQMAPIVKGNKYTWKLKLTEREMFGELIALADEQIQQMTKFELKNRASYINAFNYYCQEECYFEAYRVIEDAIKAYPEDEYFEYLKNSIF